MFSKWIKLLMIGIATISLSGCDRFLKGNPDANPDAQHVKIEFKEGQCLKDVPAQLQKFLADQDGLGTSIPCIQSALKAFMRLTRGEKADSYQGKEIQDFFNTYLLKENKITDEFQADIMKIKVLVVGGEADIVKRTELEKFIEFLGDVEKQALKFTGKIRLLSMKLDADQVKSEDLVELKKNVADLADFVFKSTKLTSSKYQWSEFLTFLIHLRQFVGQFESLDEIMRWMPLVNSAKAVFLGDNSTLQSQNDWVATTNWLIHSYITVLRYQYQIRGTAFDKPVEWVTLITWLDDVFQVLETAPLMKEKKIFDAVAIDLMIDEAYKKPLFQVKLSQELIKQTYRKALAYFVEPSALKSDAVKIKGLTEDHLKVLRAEYNIWKAAQVFFNRSFSENPNQTLESLRKRFQTIDSVGFPAVPAVDRPEYNQAWQDLRDLLNGPNVVLHDEQLRLQTGFQTPQTAVTFVGSNMLNAIRTLSRFALRGYGDKETATVFKRKISKQRMMDLEENFREFGRAVGIFDPDKTTAGKEAFEQANLLVYHSNGDEWADSREMVEILSFLISGGQIVLNEIYQGLEKTTCLATELDAFKRPWVEETCFLRVLRSDAAGLSKSIQYVGTLNDDQFMKVYKSLLKVSLSPRHRPGFLESSEIRSMATIIHFVDAIVTVYDQNRSGLLSETEVMRAYPRFKSLIKEQALKENFLAGFVLDDIYLFLVYKGRKPEGAWDITTFKTERFFGKLGEVDKLMIFNLLGVMKDYLSNASKK